MGGFSLRSMEPISVWRDEDPSITQPLVCLVPVMELPSEATVSCEGEGVERDILK